MPDSRRGLGVAVGEGEGGHVEEQAPWPAGGVEGSGAGD